MASAAPVLCYIKAYRFPTIFLRIIMSLLKIVGTKIVDEQGNEVVLRGAGLGGWMKYVNSLSSDIFSDLLIPLAWRTSFLVSRRCRHPSAYLDPSFRLSWLRVPDTCRPHRNHWPGKVGFLLRQGMSLFTVCSTLDVTHRPSSSNISSKTKTRPSSKASD